MLHICTSRSLSLLFLKKMILQKYIGVPNIFHNDISNLVSRFRKESLFLHKELNHFTAHLFDIFFCTSAEDCTGFTEATAKLSPPPYKQTRFFPKMEQAISFRPGTLRKSTSFYFLMFLLFTRNLRVTVCEMCSSLLLFLFQ